jgi:hypothetical protein
MTDSTDQRMRRWVIALMALALLVTSVGCRDQAYTRVQNWSLPAPAGSSQADLVKTPTGELLLSWVEPMGEAQHRLQLSRLAPAASATWSTPVTAGSGSDWFLNWADTPHVHALADGSLWAHWLRSTGPGRMDYGIDLVRSADQGQTWSAPQLVHLADSSGDHGFVTFWPQTADRLGIAWLDSRQKAAAKAIAGEHAGQDADGHDHHGGAAMMLRAAIYDADARQLGEWPLDVSTCDCCTTSSAMTDRGPVVVYRGRNDREIRDTRLVRFDGQSWTAPRDVHADGWQIAGCPVNGPVVSARGNTLWVAWYTEADGQPELRAARSNDAGDSFLPPVTIARGAPVLGRVTMALAEDHLLLAWLEEADTGQRLRLGRYALDLSSPRITDVATLAARGRASGMPRLAAAGGSAWLVWTDVAGEVPSVRGARID